MRRLLTFLFLWSLVGFTSGTAVLLGPVRWLTGHGRSRGWSSATEDLAVLSVIGVFVAGSALVTVWLTRGVLQSHLRHVRVGIPSLCLVAAAATLWLWLSPELMGASRIGETRVGASFTFGSYATEERMRELKAEGYTAVVSLLHPIVAPFETKLIADGKAAARRVGIEYIHVPMLPWVAENEESLARIDELARNPGGGRYYVHCYLGKDRVRLVKHLIERSVPSAAVRTTPQLAAHVEARKLADRPVLERGEVLEAGDGIWVIPYPTDDEFMSYILPGTHGHVVSLLDPDNPGDRPWIEKERALLESYGIKLSMRPLPTSSNDPHRVLEVAREMARMPRPMVVHAFLSPGSGRSPAVEALVQALRSDLPPLPPSLFVEPMDGERIRVLAPNVAVGPRPQAGAFGDYLHRRGIRRFVYLGDGRTPEARQDRDACTEAGLAWRVIDPRALDLERLRTGGPWYLYGPGLSAVESRLAEELGPAVPESYTLEDAGSGTFAARTVSFVRRAVPDVKRVVLLGPVLLLFAAVAAALAGWLRSVREVRAPYTRKIFHFAIFTLAGILHLAGGLPTVTLFGAIVSGIVLYAVLRGDGFAFYEALARPTDAPRRSLFIVIPLITTAVGGLMGNFLFGASASVGYLVAGWGDAIAEPVGTAWGRHRYRVPSIAGVPATRSLEGSAAVLFVGGLAAFLVLRLGGTPIPAALGVAAACGAAAAVVEAVSNHGLDNLTVQLAAAGTAYLLLAG